MSEIPDVTPSDPDASAAPEAEPAASNATPESAWRSRLPVLTIPLSRVQMVVGLAAGLLSISGFLYPALRATRPPLPLGELVTVVHEAKTRRPVVDATVADEEQDDRVAGLVGRGDGARQRWRRADARARRGQVGRAAGFGRGDAHRRGTAAFRRAFFFALAAHPPHQEDGRGKQQDADHGGLGEGVVVELLPHTFGTRSSAPAGTLNAAQQYAFGGEAVAPTHST